ncbi:MAG: hypothetical protein MUO58_03110, partial [Anaerolineales bacterium]|nr:hypothetical protein [Anaerolineales bacterium]
CVIHKPTILMASILPRIGVEIARSPQEKNNNSPAWIPAARRRSRTVVYLVFNAADFGLGIRDRKVFD